MKTFKQYKFWIIAIIAIMVAATIWDYQIDVFLAQYSQIFLINFFYRFFEIFGEFAATFIFVLLFGFFFNFGLRRERGIAKYFQVGLNGIGLLLFSFFQFIGFARYLFPEGGNSHGTVTTPMYFVSLVLGVILSVGINKLMDNIKDEDYRYYKKVALVGLLYIILLTVSVNLIKMVWARPRFWLIETGEAVFVPWYIINGTGQSEVVNAYMSFVSGHTANAFAFVYLSLWSINNREKWFNIAMVWGLCVAVSRLFAGQHFLSDTIGGGTIAFVLFIVLTYIFKLNINEEKFENE